MALPKKWKKIFLDALANSGNIRAAADHAGVNRDTVYTHKEKDPKFAEAFASALENACDVMEAEAFRRAVHGVKKTKGIYYQGEKIATETTTEHSDFLLAFLLKAHRPAKFRERYEISGPEGGPLTFAEIAQNVAARRANRKA